MKTIYITDIQHAALKRFAADETERRGKFISIQDAIEMTLQLGLIEIESMRVDANSDVIAPGVDK